LAGIKNWIQLYYSELEHPVSKEIM